MQSTVKFSAHVEPGTDLVRSPVTDQPCVYWRLRIVERLTARSELVHEMASSQSFRLLWGARDGGVAPVRILIEPDSARIEVTPALHRPGSPGALAVARAFGFPGTLSVEEITIHAGDEIDATGTLHHAVVDAGPFRTIEREPELYDATLTMTGATIGQALLPWAVGTAAAVLGGIGFATWAACHHAWHDGATHAARIGPAPDRVERPQFPHPRLP
jgi:hypothetical protein